VSNVCLRFRREKKPPATTGVVISFADLDLREEPGPQRRRRGEKPPEPDALAGELCPVCGRLLPT
jgi:hypothetical protein